MNQLTLDFKAKREAFKNSLKGLESLIRRVFYQRPELINLKRSNDLIRHIWEIDGDWKAESILRIARNVRIEMDTEENQLERANAEVAYRQYYA